MTRSTTAATNAEQLRWQVRSTYLMLDLIHRGQRESLPPVTWTVGDAGAFLLIRCYTRAGWHAWVMASGVDQVWPEGLHAGFLHLHAVGDVPTPDGGRVKVAVIADLNDDGGAESDRPLKWAP